MSDELELILYEKYEKEFREMLSELKEKLPSIEKIYIYGDSSSSDCPVLVFIIDGEEMDEYELLRLHPELEDLIRKMSNHVCKWVQRFILEFPEGLVVAEPIRVESEIL
jgi:selenocysteine lyase/cysteine desulfurase